MNMTKSLCRIALAATLAGATSTALAGTADWASWTSAGGGTVSGTLDVGGTLVDVTYSGVAPVGVQLNGAGTNYWAPSAPYISATVSNAPPTPDIIQLNSAGTSVITFSRPVVNPVLALVSWNGADVTFGGNGDTQVYNLQYLSSGSGFWGTGSFGNASATHFDGFGELHGVIQLLGTYSFVSFDDDTSENWHGFTVGVSGGLPSAVPVPMSAWLLGSVLGVLGMRRRQR